MPYIPDDEDPEYSKSEKVDPRMVAFVCCFGAIILILAGLVAWDAIGHIFSP